MDEQELLDRIRKGDEDAFAALVERHHHSMVALARPFVSSRAAAEEVAQESWLAMLRGLSRFEARSSLKTWLYAILINQARRAGTKERREVPMDVADDAAEYQSRFSSDGSWAVPPVPWTDAVEERLTAGRLASAAREAIDRLPPAQRLVVTLRDVEGMSPSEVCTLLELSDANQRVLLHRGRFAVRHQLEQQLGGALA